MLDEKDFQKRVQRIGGLVRELDSIADPAARTASREMLQVLMELHGTGLERILEIVFNEGETGKHLLDKLGNDSLIGSLLVLYGIHPLDFETRVTRAIERARPQLRKHGCEFELLSLQDGMVHLRVQIGEHTCGSTAKTVKTMLEDAVYEAAPDLATLSIDGLEGKPVSGFVGLETLLGNGAPAEQVLTTNIEGGD